MFRYTSPLEDGTHTMSRHFGNLLPTYVAKHPRRAALCLRSTIANIIIIIIIIITITIGSSSSKGKGYPVTCQVAKKCASTHTQHWRKNGQVVSTTTPPSLPTVAMYRRLGGPRDRFRRVRKISLPPRVEPRTVQHVASRYSSSSSSS